MTSTIRDQEPIFQDAARSLEILGGLGRFSAELMAVSQLFGVKFYLKAASSEGQLAPGIYYSIQYGTPPPSTDDRIVIDLSNPMVAPEEINTYDELLFGLVPGEVMPEVDYWDLDPAEREELYGIEPESEYVNESPDLEPVPEPDELEQIAQEVEDALREGAGEEPVDLGFDGVQPLFDERDLAHLEGMLGEARGQEAIWNMAYIENLEWRNEQSILEQIGMFGYLESGRQGALEAAAEAGVMFPWVTMGDEEVCEDCEALEGELYPADEYPEPPHFGCRCNDPFPDPEWPIGGGPPGEEAGLEEIPGTRPEDYVTQGITQQEGRIMETPLERIGQPFPEPNKQSMVIESLDGRPIGGYGGPTNAREYITWDFPEENLKLWMGPEYNTTWAKDEFIVKAEDAFKMYQNLPEALKNGVNDIVIGDRPSLHNEYASELFGRDIKVNASYSSQDKTIVFFSDRSGAQMMGHSEWESTLWHETAHGWDYDLGKEIGLSHPFSDSGQLTMAETFNIFGEDLPTWDTAVDADNLVEPKGLSSFSDKGGYVSDYAREMYIDSSSFKEDFAESVMFYLDPDKAAGFRNWFPNRADLLDSLFEGGG